MGAEHTEGQFFTSSTSFTSPPIPAEIFYILHRVFSFSWMCGKGETASGRLYFLETTKAEDRSWTQKSVKRVSESECREADAAGGSPGGAGVVVTHLWLQQQQ